MLRVAAVQLPARGIDEADLALSEALAGIVDAAERGARLVVLPECTWPAYLLGTDNARRWPATSPGEVIASLSAAAREHAVVVVVGLALPVPDAPGRFHNAAVVIESDGSVLSATHKRFLWDVDGLWFDAGMTSEVVSTSVARLGVMVCADGRMPEIARELAVAGAEVLVDPTAWVTAGADPATWNNLQAISMFPTRARENGMWSIAANKVGIERDLVAYCGRSSIVGPDGSVVAQGPPDRPSVVTADISPAAAQPPVRRRPELYGALTKPTDALPVSSMVAETSVPSAASRRLAVSSLERPLRSEDMVLLGDAGVDLVAVDVRRAGAGVEVPAPASGVVVARTSRDEAVIIGPDGEVIASWLRTHGPRAPASTIAAPVATRAGMVGVLLDEDGLAMEPARVLMLTGADVVVWFHDEDDVALVAETRAAENRILVLEVPAPGRGRSARIVGPGGAAVTGTGDLRRLTSAVVALDDVRRKEMAPGTDVVSGRQPACYGVLVGPEDAA